jgi:hypothetical protein
MSLLNTLRDRLSIKQDYRRVFSTPDGKKVLADIMKRAGVTRPVFEADPEKARLLEGHRHLAHSIYRLVHTSDELLLKLLAEEIKNQNQHESHHT